MGQWLLGSQTLNEGWIPMHKNGRQMKSASTSQQGGFNQKRSIRIMAPHRPKVNVGVALIHQYYQQIIRWREKLLICCVNKIEKLPQLSGGAGTTSILLYSRREFRLPTELPPPDKHRNNMCPSGLVVHHLTYETLQNYVTAGCSVKTGQNWTKEEIHAAVIRGPHESALAD